MSGPILESQLVSPIAEKVEVIMLALQGRPGIHQVALSTVDGLAVLPSTAEATQLAAVAGFLFAAASQASLMLQLGNKPTDVTFQGNQRFVCYPFQISSFQLILTLVVEADTSYDNLLHSTINAIGLAMAP